MFLTIYVHQFGWLSERGGNFLNLLQKEGYPEGGGGGGGGSNPGGNYVVAFTLCDIWVICVLEFFVNQVVTS